MCGLGPGRVMLGHCGGETRHCEFAGKGSGLAFREG